MDGWCTSKFRDETLRVWAGKEWRCSLISPPKSIPKKLIELLMGHRDRNNE